MATSDSLTPYSAPPETAMRSAETAKIISNVSGQAWAVGEAR
jgi:hypothetical protein